MFTLPTNNANDLFFTRKAKVFVLETYSRGIYLNIFDKTDTTSELFDCELVLNEFDGVVKSKKRCKHLPRQSQPWKLASFKKNLQNSEKVSMKLNEQLMFESIK